jgi:tetratricopeptide (TPR) repeat protein
MIALTITGLGVDHMELDNLSPRELLHFALNASNNDRSDLAIQYLKKLISLEEDNVQGLFLLGSEYAEIKMYDEALEFMDKALAIAPDAHIVRFQQAMLLLTLGKQEQAIELVKPMLELEDTNALKHFTLGLISLHNNELEEGKNHIEFGLTLDDDNEALMKNMQAILNNLNKSTSTQDSSDENDSDDEGASSGKIFLSAYES